MDLRSVPSTRLPEPNRGSSSGGTGAHSARDGAFPMPLQHIVRRHDASAASSCGTRLNTSIGSGIGDTSMGGLPLQVASSAAAPTTAGLLSFSSASPSPRLDREGVRHASHSSVAPALAPMHQHEPEAHAAPSPPRADDHRGAPSSVGSSEFVLEHFQQLASSSSSFRCGDDVAALSPSESTASGKKRIVLPSRRPAPIALPISPQAAAAAAAAPTAAAAAGKAHPTLGISTPGSDNLPSDKASKKVAPPPVGDRSALSASSTGSFACRSPSTTDIAKMLQQRARVASTGSGSGSGTTATGNLALAASASSSTSPSNDGLRRASSAMLAGSPRFSTAMPGGSGGTARGVKSELWNKLSMAVKLAHEPASVGFFGPSVVVAAESSPLPPGVVAARGSGTTTPQPADAGGGGGGNGMPPDGQPRQIASHLHHRHHLQQPSAASDELAGSSHGGTPGVSAPPHSRNNGTATTGGSAAAAVTSGSAQKEKTPASAAADAAAKANDDDIMEKIVRHEHNAFAVHVIPWDQRNFFANEYGFTSCAYCVSSKFWTRLDWTFRAALIAVLPCTILSLEPSTTTLFPLPGVVTNFAFWISSPSLGMGLRETYLCLKGASLTLGIFLLVTVIQPTSSWAFLLVFFFSIFGVAVFAEQVKKMAAWSISVYMLQYYAEKSTGLKFVEQYFVSMLIGFGFGAVSFVFPRIVWSSRRAEKHIANLGHIVSISIQGICRSFLPSCSVFERDLNLIKLRQLKLACHDDLKLLDVALDEALCEPHSGVYLAQLGARRDLLESLVNIVMAALQVVEVVADSPAVIQTPLCISFGQALQPDIFFLAAAMDQALLKLCNSTSTYDKQITATDILNFRAARSAFQVRLSEVRQALIFGNDDYKTDVSDVFLGFFLFNVDELAKTIAMFVEPHEAPSHILGIVRFPLDDLLSIWATVRYITACLLAGHVPRRVKEATKLALAMTLAAMPQIFGVSGTAVIAGPSIIAWVYQSTGAESFHYAVNRLLGTVIGSLVALMAVQVSAGERWSLYMWIACLVIVGCFVQTSPTYTQAGNAMVFSVLSITEPGTTTNSAVNRIQQNVFAILIYFGIAYLIWPVRATDKIKLHLDTGLRAFRDAMTKILTELDRTADSSAITAVVTSKLAEWKRSLEKQSDLVSPAVKEPTMVGTAFPEQTWLQIIASQQNIYSLVLMMRYAYFTFQSSASSTDSVHWMLLNRLAPASKALAELLFAAIDVYLLGLGKVTVVPTSYLVKLRIHLFEAQQHLITTYITTLIRKLMEGDTHHSPVLSHSDEPHPLRYPSSGAPNGARPANGSITSPQKPMAVAPKDRFSFFEFTARSTELHKSNSLKHMPTSANLRLRTASSPNPNPIHTGAMSPAAAAAAAGRPTGRGGSLPSRGPRSSGSSSPPSLPHHTGTRHYPSEPAFPNTRTNHTEPASPNTEEDGGGGGGGHFGPFHRLPQAQPATWQEAGTSDDGGGGGEGGDDDAASSMSDDVKSIVLSNADVHSLEAFLFAVRATVLELSQLQKALIALCHADEIASRQ